LMSTAVILWLVTVVYGIAGLVRPAVVRRLFIAATVTTFPIGWLLLHVLLAIVFFGLFTTWGMVSRLMGRDVLERRRPQGKSSYWKTRPQVTDVRRYFRQY